MSWSDERVAGLKAQLDELQTVAESFAHKRNELGRQLTELRKETTTAWNIAKRLENSYAELREAAAEFFNAMDIDEGGLDRLYTDRAKKAERALRALLDFDLDEKDKEI